MISWDLPMVDTQPPVAVTKHIPCGFSPVPINFGIWGNNQINFVQNGIFISVNRTSLEETTCSSLFYKKQIISEWLRQSGCGCYRMKHQISNLSMVYTVGVDDVQNTISMLNFRSIKFLKVYMKKLHSSFCKNQIF